MIGFFQFATVGRMFEVRIGQRNTVPSRIALMVPLGLFHSCFREYSSTRSALGVMVAHLTAMPCFFVAYADSKVTLSAVASRLASPRSKYSTLISIYGARSFSLTMVHMTRVISSPSISTMLFFVPIFSAIARISFRGSRIFMYQ